MAELKSYPVWDAPTRAFHWLNVLCVLTLAGIGLVILNDGVLGITDAGKVALKTLHVAAGYVFSLNLALRFVWGFVGNPNARWRQTLPLQAGALSRLRAYAGSMASGKAGQYLGHNPAGKFAVALLMLLLVSQAVTGLVLAGTDLFYPPLGHWIARLVAAPGVEPSTLVPYAPASYDPDAYKQMRGLRGPVALVHVYGFYVLAAAVVLHITAVVVTELRGGGTLVSAMVTGRKIIAGTPVDIAEASPQRRP